MPQLKKINLLFLFAVIALFFSISSCEESLAKEKSLETVGSVQFDIDSIRKRGSLILLTENSASTYYLYKNHIRGFDFEMVRLFAKSIGVKLEVKLLDDVDKMFDMLNKGEGDIIATNLTVTPARKQIVSFTTPVYQTRQVLAQHKIFAHPDSATILVRLH